MAQNSEEKDKNQKDIKDSTKKKKQQKTTRSQKRKEEENLFCNYKKIDFSNIKPGVFFNVANNLCNTLKDIDSQVASYTNNMINKISNYVENSINDYNKKK